MPGFQIARKSYGLTYSCPQDADENPITEHQQLIDFLVDLGGECDWIVAKELHESGKIHWHCHVKFQEKFRSQNARIFDLLGVHPNILNPGKGWVSYCTKEKDWQSNWYKNSPWSRALKAANYQEAVQILMDECPKEYILNKRQMDYSLKQHFTPVQSPGIYPLEAFREPQADNFEHSISHLVVGGAGLGKTQWVLAHFEHPLLVSQIDDLKDYKPWFHDGIVFDDMSFAHMPRTSIIHLLDQEAPRSIHCRYSNVTIPAHTRKVFCTNEMGIFGENWEFDEAITRRVNVIRVDAPLF